MQEPTQPGSESPRARKNDENLEATSGLEPMAGTQGLDPTLPSAQNLSWDGRSNAENERIGRYILLEKLGSGSYGVVYRALDEVLKRFVAIKLLNRFEDADQIEAWMHEAQVLASLDHPAIVQVYDVGKGDGGQPYIVSKFIGGGTLSRRMDKGFSVGNAVKVVSQLAEALQYLHRRGVMHRDIKPGNILITEDDDAVLADFGLALPESGYGKGARFVGTPAYMSPEQARREGHRVDGRSDIYSLGVVFYELLTGSRPFRASNQEDLLDCIRSVDVRPLRQIQASVPRELERICMKALSKKISDRYSTASDLLEDLRNWNRASAVQSTLGTTSSPVSGSDPQSTLSTPKSLDIHNVAVIPHGLRPFDSSDADFFKYLLPGARDRNGVPDSLSFWTGRILSREPSETFRVGVLLGPSGSGKSSLMRAGVLPLVASQVNTIYVEAKPEQLESNLLKQIGHRVPSLRTEATLREALIRHRQQSQESEGRKLLIVIDQFEQWLNFHRESEATDLHEALRQCDGVNSQAILLVRDDFMLGLSEFMDQIDELLLQNHNFATVEPFGAAHAREVLAAFGRAYGSLDEIVTSEQQRFLEESVEELQRLGKIEPVQLALLSEMMKDKPWSSSTLKRLGGTQGLGIAFLNDRLLGSSAHPMLRGEAEAVQRILAELLPTDDTVIKAPACPEHVIMERLKGFKSEETLSRLLQLLDTEVRLLTPTSSTSSVQGSTMGSTTSDPAYQLTHDYLVITIRRWLQSLNQGSRVGRVRQQLREIAGAWNAMPTPKRLPSLTEWASIRWFTKSSDWTAAERRMMRTTDARLGIGVLSILAILAAAFGTSYYVLMEIRSHQIVTRLGEVDSSEIADVLNDLQPLQSWVLPKIESVRLEVPAERDPDADRGRLHIALALLSTKPEAQQYVFGELSNIEDRKIGAVLQAIDQYANLDTSELVGLLRTAIDAKSLNVLPLAALLAKRDVDNPFWESSAEKICDLLARKRGNQLEHWLPLFQPVGMRLVPSLVTLGNAAKQSGDPSLDNYLTMINEYGREDSAAMVEALNWPRVDQLSLLLRNQQEKGRLALHVRERLVNTATHTSPLALGASEAGAAKKIESLDGRLLGNCGWANRVPWNQTEDLLNELKALGYSPQSIRPYRDASGAWCAISWAKDSKDYYFVASVTGQEMEKIFEERGRLGWAMRDLSCYSDPSSTDALDRTRFSGVWYLPESKDEAVQVLKLGMSSEDLYSTSLGEQTKSCVPIRYAVSIDEKGDLEHHLLWMRSSESDASDPLFWSRMKIADGDRYPGYVLTDVRALDSLISSDRGINWTDFHQVKATRLNSNQNGARDVLVAATSLSAAGDPDAALKMLDAIKPTDYGRYAETEKGAIQRGIVRQRARALARLGRAEELREYLKAAITDRITQAEKDFLVLRSAILDKDREASSTLLSKLKTVAETNTYTEDYYLRGLALVASAQFESISENAYRELLERVPKLVQSGKDLAFDGVLLDIDFDLLRTRSEWQTVLQSVGLGQRFVKCGFVAEGVESVVLELLPASEHEIKAIELQQKGFVPKSIETLPGTDPSQRGLVTSLWVRRTITPQEDAMLAERIARYSLALSLLGEQDAIAEALREKWGRGVQSYVTAHAASCTSPNVIVELLRTAVTNQDRFVFVSTLGGYKPEQFREEDLRYVVLRVKDWAQSADSAALANVSRWCLQQWKQPVDPLPSLKSKSTSSDWSTNSLGMQMVELTVPAQVLIGRRGQERIWTKVGRRIALSAIEIRGRDYEQFLNDPRVKFWIDKDKARRNSSPLEADVAQTGLSWDHAVRFCQWLNEREQIPESEWCYQNVWNPNGKEIEPNTDYLQRTGYRLPTQAEWQWACAAGSNNAWHWGSSEQLSAFFEWTLPHSEGRIHTVATQRPNALGLFDMSGNVAEWADNRFRPPNRPDLGYAVVDSGNTIKDLEQNAYLLGGRFKLTSLSGTTAAVSLSPSFYVSNSSGFRVARTIKQ